MRLGFGYSKANTGLVGGVMWLLWLLWCHKCGVVCVVWLAWCGLYWLGLCGVAGVVVCLFVSVPHHSLSLGSSTAEARVPVPSYWLAVMVYTYNGCIWKAGTRGSETQSHPQLQRELSARATEHPVLALDELLLLPSREANTQGLIWACLARLPIRLQILSVVPKGTFLFIVFFFWRQSLIL